MVGLDIRRKSSLCKGEKDTSKSTEEVNQRSGTYCIYEDALEGIVSGTGGGYWRQGYKIATRQFKSVASFSRNDKDSCGSAFSSHGRRNGRRELQKNINYFTRRNFRLKTNDFQKNGKWRN